MTERKPPEMSFRTWIDQQISQAEERGAFDNLPGAGKPLPRSDEADDGQAWLREYVRREGVPAEALLPLPLRLRKETERLAEAVPVLGSEQEVRDAAAELNGRIMEWRRIPVGPPVFVPLADEDALVGRWREAHSAGREPVRPPERPDQGAARGGAGTGPGGPSGPERGESSSTGDDSAAGRCQPGSRSPGLPGEERGLPWRRPIAHSSMSRPIRTK
jgi:hypothetical protein